MLFFPSFLGARKCDLYIINDLFTTTIFFLIILPVLFNECWKTGIVLCNTPLFSTIGRPWTDLILTFVFGGRTKVKGYGAG